MYQFAASWTDEIAEVTTDPEFQDCSARLFDPSLVVASFDIDSNGWTEDASAATLYEGQARIIGIRWGVNRENNDVGNASTMTSVTVQFPKAAVDRMKRGCKMVITEAPDNPSLTAFLFRCTSDFQGSAQASRTLEFAVDGDYVVQ